MSFVALPLQHLVTSLEAANVWMIVAADGVLIDDEHASEIAADQSHDGGCAHLETNLEIWESGGYGEYGVGY